MRFSSGNDLNVMRMLKLLREQKCLKQVPNKTVEHYTEDSRVQPRERHLEAPQTTNR